MVVGIDPGTGTINLSSDIGDVDLALTSWATTVDQPERGAPVDLIAVTYDLVALHEPFWPFARSVYEPVMLEPETVPE